MFVAYCETSELISCCSEMRRPERLISRLKSVGDEGGQRVVVLRQPKGPDGTRGFKQERAMWKMPK